jgi:4-oxalocrotonate tautomerase
MPIVNIEMYKGRPVEKKRLLAKAITDAFVNILGLKPEVVTIVFSETEKENWAIGGELQSDK